MARSYYDEDDVYDDNDKYNDNDTDRFNMIHPRAVSYHVPVSNVLVNDL